MRLRLTIDIATVCLCVFLTTGCGVLAPTAVLTKVNTPAEMAK